MEEAGFKEVWGLPHKETEHGCTIYCDTIDSGPLQEVGAEDGGLGFSELV